MIKRRKTMKRILWISRHPPQETQIKDLELAFGLVEIVEHAETIKNAKEIQELMAKEDCNDVVAVLPLNLLSDLVKMGIRPIRAIMKRTIDESGEAHFEHDYFERILNIFVETIPLPTPFAKKDLILKSP